MDRLKQIIEHNSDYNEYATSDLDDSLEKIDMVDKEKGFLAISQKVADLRYEALRNDKVKMQEINQDAIKVSATDEIYEGLLSIHRSCPPQPPQYESSVADELRMFPFIHVQESCQILSQPNPKGCREQVVDSAASLQKTTKRQMLKSLSEKADLAASLKAAPFDMNERDTPPESDLPSMQAAPCDTNKDDRLQDTNEATLLC